MSPGYGHVYRDVIIGRGMRAFDEAVDGLEPAHASKGRIRRYQPGPTAAAGITVLLRAGWLAVPCRIVYTVDGRERPGSRTGLVVELTSVDSAWLRIGAFSRGGRRPGDRMAQQYASYVKAMRDLVAAAG